MMPLKTLKNPVRTKCCVEGCSTRICSGVSMHGFPRMDRHPDLYQHWVDAIRLANKTPFWNPRKSTKVCAFHFETVENCRIRVPTVFPNIGSELASTSGNKSYDDFDEDDDFTEGDCEEDLMDTYEDSVAANSIVEEDPSSLPYEEIENTDCRVAYEAIIDEDSAMTYNEIEESYNTIVGDVVSTLTYENVMDDNVNVTYNEVEEDESAMSYNDQVEEEGTPQYDIEEEIIYDDVYADGEFSTTETQISPEQIGLNPDDLGGNKYCVVVVRHNESDKAEPQSANNLTPSKSKSTNKKSTAKKFVSKKSSKRGQPRKTNGRMQTIKAAKPLPVPFEPSIATAPSAGSADIPEEGILPNEEAQENFGRQESDSEPVGVRLEELEPSNEEPLVQTSLSGQIEMQLDEEAASPAKQGEHEASPTKKSPLKQQEAKTVPCTEQEKAAPSESACAKHKELNGVKIDDLILDGEPIKLKECSVNIVKTPTKSNSKKKATTASKNKKSPSASKEKDGKPTKKDEKIPSNSVVRDSGDGEKMAPAGASHFLEALSLKSSQEEENSGLRRSARIRAGGGRRRKFGTKGSWSVAFRDPPKKKLKVEMDEASQSSESVPYDFEDEEDPDVAVSDLEGEDEDEDTSLSEAESDVSSRAVKNSYPKPRPELNSLPTQKRRGTVPHSHSQTNTNRAKFHGYHRVRLGDQATQVGLPGSCDGFIFDVVRDDPRNVGVSCNIFYHYQPKNYRPTAWARLKSSVGTPSPAATINGIKPRLSAESPQKRGATQNERKAVESKDISIECKSKYGKPTEEALRVPIQDKNVELGERAVDDGRSMLGASTKNHDDTPVVESTNDGENADPEEIYIKVEPAMDAPPDMDNVSSDLVENAAVGGKSQKTEDISSLAEAALAELEVKEEEEFKEEDGAEMAGVEEQSCILADLCEVSHHDVSSSVNVTHVEGHAVDAGCATICSSILPVPAHHSKMVTKIVEINEATWHEGPPEQSCSVKAVENGAESCIKTAAGNLEERMDTSDAGSVEQRMDTSDACSHVQAESDNSSKRKVTFVESPSGTVLTSSPNRAVLPIQGDNCTARTEHLAAPSVPPDERSDSLNDVEPVLKDGKFDDIEDTECALQSSDLPGVFRRTIDSAKVAGDGPAIIEKKKLSDIQTETVVSSATSSESLSAADTVNCSAEYIKSPSQAEMLDFRKDAENVEESTGSNELAGAECAAESSDAMTDLSMTEPEKVEQSSNSDGVQASDECLEAMADTDKPSDVSVHAGMPGSRTDTQTVGESNSISAYPEHEAECQDSDQLHGGKNQGEAADRQNYLDFSSESSDSDSLIEVPVPEFSSDSDVRGPEDIPDFGTELASNRTSQSCDVPDTQEETTEKQHQAPNIDNDANPLAGADSAKGSHLRKCCANLESPEDAEDLCEVPVTDIPLSRTVPKEDSPSEEKVSQVQSENSQEVFDSIERNLEKMFDMDR